MNIKVIRKEFTENSTIGELLIEKINIFQKYRKEQKIDKSSGSMFNSWRAKVYTKKGKDIGFPEKWKTFNGFKEDMENEWSRNLILIRKDSKKPFSKENCMWVEKGCENINKLIKLTYNNEEKTIMEWCYYYDLNYNGVRQRFFKGKNYTIEEILFGKKVNKKPIIQDINSLSFQKQKNKVSKMLSAYKCKDKKKGFNTDIDNNFLMEMINKPCVYCGDKINVGLDRLNNNKGHLRDNVVPACYTCNTTRSNNFSFQEMLLIGEVIKNIKNKRNIDNV